MKLQDLILFGGYEDDAKKFFSNIQEYASKGTWNESGYFFRKFGVEPIIESLCETVAATEDEEFHLNNILKLSFKYIVKGTAATDNKKCLEEFCKNYCVPEQGEESLIIDIAKTCPEFFLNKDIVNLIKQYLGNQEWTRQLDNIIGNSLTANHLNFHNLKEKYIDDIIAIKNAAEQENWSSISILRGDVGAKGWIENIIKKENDPARLSAILDIALEAINLAAADTRRYSCIHDFTEEYREYINDLLQRDKNGTLLIKLEPLTITHINVELNELNKPTPPPRIFYLKATEQKPEIAKESETKSAAQEVKFAEPPKRKPPEVPSARKLPPAPAQKLAEIMASKQVTIEPKPPVAPKLPIVKIEAPVEEVATDKTKNVVKFQDEQKVALIQKWKPTGTIKMKMEARRALVVDTEPPSENPSFAPTPNRGSVIINKPGTPPQRLSRAFDSNLLAAALEELNRREAESQRSFAENITKSKASEPGSQSQGRGGK